MNFTTSPSGMTRPFSSRAHMVCRVGGLVTLVFFVALLSPGPIYAYIGPGAGIAFLSSFLIFLTTCFVAGITLLTWPFQWLIRFFRARHVLRNSRVRRVLILGLDGQDPNLTERMMSEGRLPNFQKLYKTGSYLRLKTSLPAESPVAWASFQTGCNPGRHRVFDFLIPDRKSYLPKLCSAVISPSLRNLDIGPYRIPLGKAQVRFERKSQSFWKILGDHGVFSTIQRVPITFPPEKFHGVLLSAMSVPDLLGTQGTFSYYSSDEGDKRTVTGGAFAQINLEDGAYHGQIDGPENPFRCDGQKLHIDFILEPLGDGKGVRLRIGDQEHLLELRRFTPWILLEFRAGFTMKIRGICRFYLLEKAPHMRLYMSPVNIDPENPALPISYPATYSMYLAKTQGRFSTLGLAEDTWALNERVLDEDAFLEQAYLVHEEREKMFLDAIEKTEQGLAVCVFDITDRVQHMFWRYLEKDHPSNVDKDVTRHKNAIFDLYERMDGLVGRVMANISDDTVVLVMSDHGFKSFQRGVNLNSWLHQEGYLAVHSGPSGAEWFTEVDWKRTRAYAVGLGGIYLNVRGREAQGIVDEGDAAQKLKNEIREKLTTLFDSQLDRLAVGHVYDTSEAYSGPYSEEGPDLIVGFKEGYRAAWTSVTGAVTNTVFEDNSKSWSGDHCINPPDVPGILFCNRKIREDNASIMDIAPSVLDLFGVPIPSFMDGVSLFSDRSNPRSSETGKD